MGGMSAPTAAARALVAGAYDTHVHVAPDVMERRIDDLDLAHRFAAVGLSGFVLKSHYVTTAERAAVVRQAVPGVDVLGAITDGLDLFADRLLAAGFTDGEVHTMAVTNSRRPAAQ